MSATGLSARCKKRRFFLPLSLLNRSCPGCGFLQSGVSSWRPRARSPVLLRDPLTQCEPRGRPRNHRTPKRPSWGILSHGQAHACNPASSGQNA